MSQSQLVYESQVGRFRNQYLTREGELANEETKEPCREKVANFILSNHDQGNLRMFSLPSMHWRFEHLINDRHSAKCEFVGVERDIAVVKRAMAWMPGRNACWFDRGFRQLQFAGARTDRAWLVHMDCETFVRLGQRGVLDIRDKRVWHLYRLWTAIWLDFTSQLCRGVELILPKLGAGCDKECDSVPVAITVLKGREPEDMAARLAAFDAPREDYIAALLNSGRHRRFELVETFEYVSGPGSTMLTVMGLLRTKPIEPAHDEHMPPVYIDNVERLSVMEGKVRR